VSGLDEVADKSFAYLTTRGRRTGRPHEIEIWFAVHRGRTYVLAGGGRRADWVRNLLADPRVGLRIGDRRWEARAGLVEDLEEEARVRRVLAAKYQGWREGRPLSGWARKALVVAVEPVEP
jgi:deazaflavin-dependent oxidoreductase (nitroreductase family)